VKYPAFVFIGARRVRLAEDYQLPDGKYIPRGFESDLGSVPKFLWWLLSPHDIKYASIVHDYEWLLADLGRYSYIQSNKKFLQECGAVRRGSSVESSRVPYSTGDNQNP
jgi:Protein of unknown function (DUF1353).